MKHSALYIALCFSLFFMSEYLSAANRLGHTGRIVDSQGRPVSGQPNLRFEIFHEGNATPLCSYEINNVPLVNGIYHVELNFACDLQNVISTLPPGMRLLSRVTDITDLGNPNVYDYQTIMSVPMAFRADQAALAEEALTLADQGASDGQFLRWNSGSETWQPYTLDLDDFGTVQSLQGQAPIEIAGTAEEPEVRLLFNATHFELSGSQLQLNAGAITDAMISASADIAQSKIAGLPTRLTTIESDISDLQSDTQASLGTGDPGQYLDHDLTWQDLDTSAVAEGSRLYFTQERVLLTELDGYVMATGPVSALDNGNSLIEALGKLEYMISTQSDGDFMRDGSVTMTGALRFEENANEISLTTPTGLNETINYILPVSPSAGYFLQTDSDGVLSWQPIDTTSGSITSVEREPTSAITTSTTDGAVTVGIDLTELTAQLTGKEDTLPSGSDTTHYLRGDRTWQSLNTLVVTEEAPNLYFTQTRVLQTPLTDFTLTSGEITDADSVLSALEKLLSKSFDLKDDINDLSDDLTASEGALETYADDQIAAAIASVDQSKWEEVAGGIHYDQGHVGVGVDNPLAALHLNGSIIISDGGEDCTDSNFAGLVRFASSTLQFCDGTDWITLSASGEQAPPSGAAGGELDGSYPNPIIRTGVVTNAHIAADAAIDQLKIAGLVDDLDSKQDALPSGGTSADYLDGTMSWQTLNTSVVAEHTDNLYFTQERVRTTPLAGYLIGTATALSPGDTVLSALAKLEALILNTESRFPETTGTEGQILMADSLGELFWKDLSLSDLEGVPETRMVAAGPGLSGGGDLSADLSLAVVVDNQTIEISSNALQLRDNGINDQHIAPDAEIAMSKIAGLVDALDDKQDGLNLSGNTAHLLDGGGNWRSLASSDIPNLDAAKITTGSVLPDRLPNAEELNTNCPTDHTLVSDGDDFVCVNSAALSNWVRSGAHIHYTQGRVGIGTTNPATELTVNGAITLHRQENNAPRMALHSENHELTIENYGGFPDSDIVFRANGDGSLGSGQDQMIIKANGNVGVGTIEPQAKLEVEGGNMMVNELPLGSFNPYTSFAVAGQDYSHFITAISGTWEYSSAHGGILTTGPTWFRIRTRLPVDEKAAYKGTLRVEKLDGTGTVYLGAVSLDDSFEVLQTDLANSYNYFAARAQTVTAGTQATFSGTISGINQPTDTNHDRFDPGAKYFDLVVITNYQGTGQSVVRGVDVQRLPLAEVWHDAVYQDGWIDYSAGWPGARYYMDHSGNVHLGGLAREGTIGGSSCIFTLPLHYRPQGRRLFPVQSGNALGRVDVLPSGCVTVVNGNPAWVSLDGIIFKANYNQ